VAALLLAGIPQTLLAAQDLTELSLEQLLDVQIYSASKFYEKASDAPSWITVITGEDIRQYGWRTLAEVLRAVPGFYVFNDRIYDYAGVRGFGRLGDFDSRLLVLLDEDPELGTKVLWNMARAMALRVRFILWQLQRALQKTGAPSSPASSADAEVPVSRIN
jgi:hypothetical protein